MQRDTAAFITRIEERKSWAMIRMANGKTGQRVTCPARECKVSCPLIALSDTEEVRNSGVPRVTTPPAASGRPHCSTQTTVELPFAVTPQVRQSHSWGSLKWIKSFARRTHVEGVFGNVKNCTCENLARGWLQAPGLVRTSIGMAFVLAAYNRRIAQSWNDRTGASTDPAFRPVPPFLGYREITEDDDRPAA